jgi:type IV secretory pathway VirB2 component (pilin)
MSNSIKLDTDLAWRALMFFCFLALIFGISDDALAGSTEGDAIGARLCVVVQSLSGGIAKAVATIAIIGVAGGLLLGKLNWVTAMTVSVGVIIIFSAGSIVSWISGSEGISADTNCDDLAA